MQGIFIAGSRPKSKKQIKELVDSINQGDGDPYELVIEATSFFGNEYDGSLANAPKSAKGFTFVGPDPNTNRKFYGTISWDEKNQKWVVK